jgi:uncharacterized protein
MSVDSKDEKVAKNVEIRGKRREMIYPFKRQVYGYDCGASCMETVLTYFGYYVREDDIMKIAGTDEDGTTIKGLIKVAKKYGLKCKARENMTINDLKKYINKGRPCITPIQAWCDKPLENWEDGWSHGHYVVPIGYDDKKIYFEDPMSNYRTYLLYTEMERRWHDQDEKDTKLVHFGLMFYGKPERFDNDEVVHMD